MLTIYSLHAFEFVSQYLAILGFDFKTPEEQDESCGAMEMKDEANFTVLTA